MKNQLSITAIVMVVALFAFSQVSSSQGINYDDSANKLSSFTAVGIDNVKQTTEPEPGKYFLLDVSLTGCGACIEDIPKMVKLSQQYSDKLDAVILWNSYNFQGWEKFLQIYEITELPLPMMLDDEAAITKALDIKLFPTYLLFDKQGVLIKRWKARLPKNIGKHLQ